MLDLIFFITFLQPFRDHTCDCFGRPHNEAIFCMSRQQPQGAVWGLKMMMMMMMMMNAVAATVKKHFEGCCHSNPKHTHALNLNAF